MDSPTVVFKRGSTFGSLVTYVPGSGDPANLDDVVIESSVLDRAGKRYVLTIDRDPDNIHFTTTFEDTADWQTGTAAWDFKCTKNGVLFYSTTVRFIIELQITL
ncbi:hypothetical protein UFOVP201_35 [uncultured Caudovirales phage]|uniref:Uncharacterized protein n=1 Tax=uncultured Caudovirales phage TaxID=2100421 RepID=A0A6J7WIX7_9CAUD|nr:hypothetical protein UFOVP201_35 [uncultured Caudovirales phage]